MDRVLLACDQIQYATHVEMTLRKVGYDVETMASEYNLSEKLLTFNPDIVIVRGQSAKLSTLSLGIKLKEQFRFSGKVILILSSESKINPDDLNRAKKDLLLFEPIGALKLAFQVLNFDPQKKELMQDRLLRMAETDATFRTQEQAYLVQYDQDLSSEIIKVQGGSEKTDSEFVINEEDLKNFTLKKDATSGQNGVVEPVEKQSAIGLIGHEEPISEDIKVKLSHELIQAEAELPLRIDSYNLEISSIDHDLKKGIKKRQSHRIAKELRKEFLVDPGQEKMESLDQEKKRFANALFKKNK